MIGYKIKLNTQIFFVPFESYPLVTLDENEVRLSAALYDTETDTVTFLINEKLKESDQISIMIEKTESFSKPIQIYYSQEELKKAKEAYLKEYLDLKEELERKGLI